jgi:hypothetical protein
MLQEVFSCISEGGLLNLSKRSIPQRLTSEDKNGLFPSSQLNFHSLFHNQLLAPQAYLHIRHLVLTHNKIRVLTEECCRRLGNLEVLDLRNNYLEQLSPHVKAL